VKAKAVSTRKAEKKPAVKAPSKAEKTSVSKGKAAPSRTTEKKPAKAATKPVARKTATKKPSESKN
jgi:hypothetical protein